MSHRVAFGSCRERNLFPGHVPTHPLGEAAREEAARRGPGCYDNHKIGTIMDEILKKPESNKGYVLAARTTARFFTPRKLDTPSPQAHQEDQSCSKVCPPGKTPFNSSTTRFVNQYTTVSDNQGPGTYVHDAPVDRKVSWPMCFGAPDWSSLAQMEKRTVRVKLDSEKMFVMQRSRAAYLSLYFSY